MKKNEFIKQIRQKYKMSQKKFAEYLEVSKSLIEKVEMGRSEATPENKYVKAACALEGLDNEIFNYDEITDKVLKKHELSKFSKAFRKFLYFYYGDFWNEDLENILIDNIKFTFMHYTNFIFEESFRVDFLKIFGSLKFYITYFNNDAFEKDEKRLFIEILLILSLSKVNKFYTKPSQFECYPNEYINFLKNEVEGLISYLHIDSFKKAVIIDELSQLEDRGVLITIENIKKLKKQKELEIIQEEVIPAPTDPKDKQICELLQYAPTAFKDKIIEKLLQYKKDVEDF